MRLGAVVLGALLIGTAAAHASPDLSAVLQNMSEKLVAQSPQQGGNQPTLAVFPLNSAISLAREGVGEAFSQLLTHEMVQTRRFTVVERSELVRLLEEQRLQHSGAIDPDKAVAMGRLLGAELAILGSIERIDNKYLINARLVRVKNAEVLGTAFEEVPIEEFSRTAEPLLAPVPKSQSFGFYFGYRDQSARTTSGTRVPITTNGATVFRDYTGRGLHFTWAVFGLRYNPWERWGFDVAGMLALANPVYADFSDLPGTGAVAGSYSMAFRHAYALRALAGRRWAFGNHMSAGVSAGVVGYLFRFDDGSRSSENSGSTSAHPTAQARFEYRPQPRFGLGLSFDYDLTRTNPALSSTSMNLQPWSLEPAVSLNF